MKTKTLANGSIHNAKHSESYNVITDSLDKALVLDSRDEAERVASMANGPMTRWDREEWRYKVVSHGSRFVLSKDLRGQTVFVAQYQATKF